MTPAITCFGPDPYPEMHNLFLKDPCIKETHQNGLDVSDTMKMLRKGVLDRTDIGGIS